jgi:hypothetical protein
MAALGRVDCSACVPSGAVGAGCSCIRGYHGCYLAGNVSVAGAGAVSAVNRNSDIHHYDVTLCRKWAKFCESDTPLLQLVAVLVAAGYWTLAGLTNLL